MVEHDRALGHLDLEVLAPGAMAVAAAAMRAVLALAVRMVTKREQRRDVAVGARAKIDPPSPPSPPSGPPFCDMGLASEGDTARATIAALDVDVALVDEVGHPARLRGVPSSEGDYSSSRTGSPTISTDQVVRS